MRTIVLIALCWLLPMLTAQAHQASTSYLQLRVDDQALSGRWDIALRDLDYAIGLDVDGDGSLRWGEVRAAEARIAAYALARLSLQADGQVCQLHETALAIADHSDGRYAVLSLRGSCPASVRQLDLRYSLLFDLDTLHRGLLRLDFAGVQNGLFASDRRELHFDGRGSAPLKVFAEYFHAGVWHVWTGWDHMLFLAGLFLPAVLRRQGRVWLPAPSLRAALRDTAWTVTAFTIAHAITLTLAATGLFSPPTRWVESAVAATVLFAGLNNLVPMVHRRLYALAGAFGLVHGAAIAGALIELGLPPGARVWALLAFNIGVEAGQLAVLLAVVPLSFALRRSVWYRRLVFVPGALFVSVAGLLWLLERGFGLSLGVPLP